jgi:hypothetical protein
MIDLLEYLKSSVPRAIFLSIIVVISPLLAILVLAILLGRHFLHGDPLLELLQELKDEFKPKGE